MELMTVEPMTIVPMPAPAQHALAATWALNRAKRLLAPDATPDKPQAPDVPGARDAFEEAVQQLKAALEHAGGRPGHREIEAALEEANEALMHLTRPGVHPPIADVAEHAWRGAELTRTALELFEGADAWTGPAL